MQDDVLFWLALIAFVGFFSALLWLGKRRDARRVVAVPLAVPKDAGRGPAGAPSAARPTRPTGFALRVRIERLDSGPPSLAARLPWAGELVDLFSGPDGQPYSLLALERPLPWKGRDARYVLLTPAHVGGRIGQGSVELPVQIAVVVNDEIRARRAFEWKDADHVALGFLDAHGLRSVLRAPGPPASELAARFDALPLTRVAEAAVGTRVKLHGTITGVGPAPKLPTGTGPCAIWRVRAEDGREAIGGSDVVLDDGSGRVLVRLADVVLAEPTVVSGPGGRYGEAQIAEVAAVRPGDAVTAMGTIGTTTDAYVVRALGGSTGPHRTLVPDERDGSVVLSLGA